MTLEEVSASTYQEVIREPYTVFNSAPFNSLNSDKVERVFYFLFRDSKYRLGLIAAQNQGALVSPFSAPYGGFTPIYNDVKIQSIEEAVDLTIVWAKQRGLTKIKFTLPPPVYNESYLAKVSNVLYRRNFGIDTLELNFHFNLSKLTDDYTGTIWRNARKNLAISFASKLEFDQCLTVENKEAAYNVIQYNRAVRGKPLRMQWKQVLATSEIIPSDFFLVRTAEKKEAAAAIVFKVAPGIAQVIYWGDIPDFQNLKTMNFLSFKVFEFYKERSFRVVDIGYSTDDSIPNYGLCEFKESLGCDIQPKHTFSRML